MVVGSQESPEGDRDEKFQRREKKTPHGAAGLKIGRELFFASARETAAERSNVTLARLFFFSEMRKAQFTRLAAGRK